jgi:P pilus assembly chaperone PapD
MRQVLITGLFLLSGLAPGVSVAQTTQTQSAPTQAPGAFLNITPKRLTFDRGRRSGAVFILNQGSEAITVDLTVTDRVMLPDGQIFPADEAAKRADGQAVVAQLKSAKDLVQISPRRVTLQPGRPQTVRVRLGSLPDPALGEHRSHLTVTTIPPRDAGTTPEAAAAGAQNQLSFQIVAVYGLSIPLIVRPGEADVRATIEGAHVEFTAPQAARPQDRPAPILTFDLVRQGSSSAYGNLQVQSVGAKRGAEPLGVVRGVAVYPEIARRTVRIPLVRAPSPGEQLEVTLTDDDSSPGKVIAKAAF